MSHKHIVKKLRSLHTAQGREIVKLKVALGLAAVRHEEMLAKIAELDMAVEHPKPTRSTKRKPTKRRR